MLCQLQLKSISALLEDTTDAGNLESSYCCNKVKHNTIRTIFSKHKVHISINTVQHPVLCALQQNDMQFVTIVHPPPEAMPPYLPPIDQSLIWNIRLMLHSPRKDLLSSLAEKMRAVELKGKDRQSRLTGRLRSTACRPGSRGYYFRSFLLHSLESLSFCPNLAFSFTSRPSLWLTPYSLSWIGFYGTIAFYSNLLYHL